MLTVYASGTTWPADDYYSGARHVRPTGDGDLVDVYVAGTVEGYTQVLVGLDGTRAPFRVFALAGPPASWSTSSAPADRAHRRLGHRRTPGMLVPRRSLWRGS